jgi:phytoene dehydrogenase-like protein
VEPDLTIVGGGLTGLIAAIEAAERGWRVVVAEAHSRPGGRARSLAAPFRANVGAVTGGVLLRQERGGRSQGRASLPVRWSLATAMLGAGHGGLFAGSAGRRAVGVAFA